MEYYFAFKYDKDILSHATSWMDLDLKRKKSQSQDKYCMIPLK